LVPGAALGIRAAISSFVHQPVAIQAADRKLRPWVLGLGFVWFLLWLGVVSAPASQKLTLAWDRSVDASVTGYKLYYKETAATNFTAVNVGNTNLHTLPGLGESRTYTFYVTCYNAAGLESDPSNSVGYTVPLAPLTSTAGKDAQGRAVLQLRVEAMAGRQVRLQSSTDLQTWATVVTSAVGQPIDFVVLVASEPKRFYRSVLLN
jgi:hypothetical protein